MTPNSSQNYSKNTNDNDINYEQNKIDEELVAIIAASIAMILDKAIPEINIKTIKRVPQYYSPWTDMGRKENMINKI